MNPLNTDIANKMIMAAECLHALDGLDVKVLTVDINNAVPLLRVQPAKGLHKLSGAWRRSRRLGDGNRIDLMRGQLARCFIEWEVRP